MALPALLVLVAATGVAWAQRRQYVLPNAPYVGRLTFVRLRYTQGYRMAWSADYPQVERNFMTILSDLSAIQLHKDQSNVYTLNDPGFFRVSDLLPDRARVLVSG